MFISALHFEWKNLDEAFDRCVEELGLDGIEFSVAPGSGFPYLGEADYPTVGRLTQKYGATALGHVRDGLLWFRCAVKRRCFSVGDRPTWQLSLRPVAIGRGCNEAVEAFGAEGRP